MSDGQTKQFGKGQRTVPAPAQKAQKWYPVDDESQPKKVSIPRESIYRRDIEKEYGHAPIVTDECDHIVEELCESSPSDTKKDCRLGSFEHI